jgi:hypothetical protein
MTTRTKIGQGLSRPHKGVAARPGIGSGLTNAKSIATERSPKGKTSQGGVAHTYFGNSRACDTDCNKK